MCLKFLKIYDKTKTLETSQVSEAWSKGWPDSKRNINFVEYNKNEIIDKINVFFGYQFIKDIKLLLIKEKIDKVNKYNFSK